VSTPIVTENPRRPEPVAHDTFIDDLRPPLRPAAASALGRRAPVSA
jgi:hypothetical protein